MGTGAAAHADQCREGTNCRPHAASYLGSPGQQIWGMVRPPTAVPASLVVGALLP
jgi:hypothetical protein